MTSRVKSRRPLRPVAKVPVASPIARIALSRPARTAYYVLGTAGLAALAAALYESRIAPPAPVVAVPTESRWKAAARDELLRRS